MSASSWRWTLLLSVLGGGKVPELPQYVEARRYVARDEALTGDERAELLADASVSATEVALLLGLSRQRVYVLRKALHPPGGVRIPTPLSRPNRTGSRLSINVTKKGQTNETNCHDRKHQ